jgi:hypothetical protein
LVTFAGPGWESFLKYCRKGLTAAPATDVVDIRDLKPEALYAVIKTAALLSDLSKTLALLRAFLAHACLPSSTRAVFWIVALSGSLQQSLEQQLDKCRSYANEKGY